MKQVLLIAALLLIAATSANAAKLIECKWKTGTGWIGYYQSEAYGHKFFYKIFGKNERCSYRLYGNDY
jgi:opacity protein-like surface antigen